MYSIEARNLSKCYSYYKKELGFKGSVKNLFKRQALYKEAVKDVSFRVEEGEIVGFLGPNGAGKTTTLKILSGILFPTSGIVTVMGFVPWEREKKFKRQFSIVMGQKNQLWPDLPANESLHLNKFIYEIDTKEFNQTLSELSELLDVKDILKVQVRRLSLGERMKIELIAAILHRPKVLFLDEPTIGLDFSSQKKIRDFLKHYNQENKTTIILTSHYMRDIEDLCKRAVIINEGKIVFDDKLNKVNDIFNNKKLIKLHLDKHMDKEVLAAYGTIRHYDGVNVTIEVDRDQITACSRTILDNLSVKDFNIEEIPVEDGIQQLYEKSLPPVINGQAG